MQADLTKAMKILGYSSQWLDSGLINKQFLMDQLDEYQSSEDKNTEHYRYTAFQDILKTNTTLSDNTLEMYIELASIDEDHAMGKSALGDLVTWSGLSQK